MKIQIKNLAVRSGLFVIMVILLVACGNTRNKENEKEQNIATQEVSQVETSQTPDITFKDEAGKTVSLRSLKGKVVFINFWATWCPPCIREMPSIDELKDSFKESDDIVFLMVDVDNKMEKSSAFMQENDYDLPVYVPASNIPSDFLRGAIPTTVIIDKKGKMVARMEGGRNYRDPQIIKALKELVEDD